MVEELLKPCPFPGRHYNPATRMREIEKRRSATRRLALLLGALLLLFPVIAPAQGGYGRRRGVAPTSPGNLEVVKNVNVTFNGKLKDIDKKKLMIETEEGHSVSIRLSGKTKFFQDGKPIKRSDIDLETPITVDASEQSDLSMLASKVTVDPPPKASPQ